jgi:CRP-like cAMP-binding protein
LIPRASGLPRETDALNGDQAMQPDQKLIEILKSSIPFRILPVDVLSEIIGIARHASFAKDDVVYEVGANADDIYVIVSGEVEHAFDPREAVATNLVKVVERGAVFGWAALFKQQPSQEPRHRLAKTTCLKPTEALIISGEELTRVLDAHPTLRKQVMEGFKTMVSREYGFVGFVKVRGEFVEGRIGNTGSGTPTNYDSFGF